MEAATGTRPAITAVTEDTTASNTHVVAVESTATSSSNDAIDANVHSDTVPLEHMLYLFAQQRLAIVDAWQQKPHLQDRPLPMTETAKENKRIRSSMQNHSNRQLHT
jgi:hypothetical protein